MNCAELEVLICDYVDGTLPEAERLTVERHLSACAACAALVQDAAAAVRFMESAADVEPPPELMGRILADAHSGRHGRLGRSSGWLSGIFHPMLRPRLVMSMAMTVFSFAMLARLLGMPQRQLQPSDLSPANVWAAVDDRVTRAWQRTVKFYESIRVVYQIQSRLREWQDEQDRAAAEEAAPDESRKLPARQPANSGPAPPSSEQNGAPPR